MHGRRAGRSARQEVRGGCRPDGGLEGRFESTGIADPAQHANLLGGLGGLGGWRLAFSPAASGQCQQGDCQKGKGCGGPVYGSARHGELQCGAIRGILSLRQR